MTVKVSVVPAIDGPIFAVAYFSAHGFWQQNAAGFIGSALTGLLGVLIGTGVGFWQWRQSQRSKLELESTRLDWERQRLGLEDRMARERIAWEEQQRVGARRAAAESAMQARLAHEAELGDNVERQAIAYRGALISELRNLKILDMTKPLDLEALYVQLQVREEDPPRYVKDEDVATLARGDPEQLLRLSQVRLGERAALALTPEDAFRRFNRIAVLGDPGAGKTTMLRHLAFRIARGEFVGSVVLPVYVELRRFVDSGRADLLDFAVSEWHERYGFLGTISYLEQELAAGRAALLLDGLDEVLGGETAEAAGAAYNRVAREIDRLATRFPNVPIAVTCRRVGWRGKLPAFQTLEVLDFSWDQIQTFLKNWFSESPAKALELRGALAGNLRMQTFAANPLMLSLIAIVYERELELPERRAQLYNRVPRYC
jgi:predicted NACHT family NTPase